MKFRGREMPQKNVFGSEIQICNTSPMTGFYRNGCCETGSGDGGLHIICAEVTDEFLEFTKAEGNDLCTAVPEYGFPGLKAGDRWCLCASRWRQAMEAGCAPPVVLEATHETALEVVPLNVLQKYELDKKL
jgi:uncharacterized protein (DUF2237 family)